MARDIAQEIIDAKKAGKPDYVITGLMKEREDKIKKDGLKDKVPTTKDIIDYANSIITGGTREDLNPVKINPETGKPYVTEDFKKLLPIVPNTPKQPPLEPVSVVSSSTPAAGGTGIYGYNPEDYGASSSSGSSFFGYIVVGLVGIVLLDKLLK